MELGAVIKRIASRYPSRWTRGYIHGKIRSDPAYRITREILEKSSLPVLDIGCGLGFFAFYLREFGFAPPIVGLDLDAAKIRRASEVAQMYYRDLNFRVQDAATVTNFLGNVVMLDVLQYMERARQHDLLAALPAMVAPGGTCLIRATPRDQSWRFRLTCWEDRAMNAVDWIKMPIVHYLSAEEIARPFRAAGFSSEIRPLWGKTPFNSHLFRFANPASAPVNRYIESPPSTVKT